MPMEGIINLTEEKRPTVFSRVLDGLWFGLIVGLLLYVVLFKSTIVQGSSMAPTYETGDRLIVLKYQSKLASLKHGDVVVFHSPSLDKYIIKRLIGLPGDVLEINGSALYRNGELVEEDYINETHWNDQHLQDQTLTVPEGSLYVMGDNRNYSDDSRFNTIGLVNIDEDLVGPVRIDLTH